MSFFASKRGAAERSEAAEGSEAGVIFRRRLPLGGRAGSHIRDKRLKALKQIELQRARLHVKELEINAGLHDEPEHEPAAVPINDDRPRRRSRSM